MFPSKSRSRTGTGRKWGWAGMSILTYQLGTVPSNNPLVDVPVQKTHKNRNWGLETEAEAVSVRRSIKQSIGLMFPGPKDTYQWKLKLKQLCPMVCQTIHWLMFPSKKLTIHTVQQFESIVFSFFFFFPSNFSFLFNKKWSLKFKKNIIIIIILKNTHFKMEKIFNFFFFEI
jgi:hypothetical protein